MPKVEGYGKTKREAQIDAYKQIQPLANRKKAVADIGDTHYSENRRGGGYKATVAITLTPMKRLRRRRRLL